MAEMFFIVVVVVVVSGGVFLGRIIKSSTDFMQFLLNTVRIYCSTTAVKLPESYSEPQDVLTPYMCNKPSFTTQTCHFSC
jgi:hypothetical protein